MPQATATGEAPVEATHRRAVLTTWLATIVCATAGVGRIWSVDIRELAASLQDDSFYYLLSAWRAARADGVLTFDGEHTTYGVQPAFAAVLTLLAWPTSDRDTYLRLALSFAVVLHAVTSLLLQSTVQAMLRRAGATGSLAVAGGVLAAGAWLANMPVTFGSTTLKENVLYAPLLALAWSATQSVDRSPHAGRIGVVLGLSVACRLTPSSLLLASILAGAVVLRAAGTRARAAVAGRLAAGGLLAVAPFLAYGHFVMGRLLPTSGAVKMEPLVAQLHDGSYWHNLPEYLGTVPTYLLACLRYSLGLPHGYFFVPQDPAPPHTAGFVIAPLSLLGLLWLWRRRVELRASARLLTLLVLAALLGKAATCLMLTPWGNIAYLQWYVAGLPVLVTALAGCAAGWLPERGALVLAGLTLAGATTHAVATCVAMPTSFRSDPRSWQRQMLVTTAMANELLPEHSRIAASNSGALGYFAREDLVVVNVDGLANDDFVVAKQARCPMWDYLQRERITHLCDVMPRHGWRENPFDSVRPIAVLPFVGTDYDGYFLLERTSTRFPNFWPVVGTATNRAADSGPVVTVPWLPAEALPTLASPPDAIASGAGSWANWRIDGPTGGAGLRFHLGGAYAAVELRAGGRSGLLQVLADGKPVTQVPCTADSWPQLAIATEDAAELAFEWTPADGTAAAGPLWLVAVHWQERTAAASPRTAACEPFGSGCAMRGEIPQLEALGAVLPGSELGLRIRAAPQRQGVLWLTIGSSPSRLSPIGAGQPCYAWCGPQVVAIVPFVTGDDGLVTVPWSIPSSPTGVRYVAQALLGKDTPDASFSNGLRIDVP